MGIKVVCEVDIYEKDGGEANPADEFKIIVESHWNYSDRVTLVVGGHRYTVIGDHLIQAIRNAENHAR